MIDLTQPMILAPGASFTAIASLPEEIRRRLGEGAGDVAVSRPGSRALPVLIDADAEALIKGFTEPSGVVAAVLRYSEARGADPEEVLAEAYPLLKALTRAQLLAPAEAAADARSGEPLLPGAEIDGHRILCAVQLMDDTAVYQVACPGGDIGALKIAQRGAPAQVSAALLGEAELLSGCAASCVPRLRAVGRWRGSAYLVQSWRPGAPAVVAAQELRSLPHAEGRPALAALAAGIARAYAQLHAAGVVHGDVHPGNLLVDASGRISIIDLGLAAGPSRQDRPPRGGAGFAFEPEYARAILQGAPPPPATPTGEQYVVASLIYQLVTGQHHLDFQLITERALGQIASEAPRPFEAVGGLPWPTLEAALTRAMAVDPRDRCPDMDALADALEGAARSAEPQRRPGSSPQPSRALRALKSEVLTRLSPGGALFEAGFTDAPRCSVNLGAAGVAYAAYRVACNEDDPRLLSLADLWLCRARAEVHRPDAFVADDKELGADVIGETSLGHTVAGVCCVDALISTARGDRAAALVAAEGLRKISEIPETSLDPSLGPASLLLGMAAVAEALPEADLTPAGRALLSRLWGQIDALGPIGEAAALTNLGIAHGWGGLLHATLRFCIAAGLEPPASLKERLAQLAARAEPWGRGLRWRRDTATGAPSPADYLPSWCNGSAGLVHLWLLAYRSSGEPRYLELARGAAWSTFDDPSSYGDLCCGLGGRAYALLALYRVTGEPAWLRRAGALANGAVQGIREASLRWDSLYKGAPGLAVLASDLERPEESAMPLFDVE